MLGIVATGGLGWLAAVSYDGSTVLGATAIVTTGDDGAGVTTSPSSPSPTTSTATSTAPTVTSVQGGAHVSTGGS